MITEETKERISSSIMGKPCKYCGQTNTHKDEFGFCKRYSCFSVSGKKAQYENLLNERRDIKLNVPTYKRNQFDGIPYNPQEDQLKWNAKKISELLAP